ncbi:hypothetical protein FEM48_Zijuj10G0150800 [Ziziphus jujuba var. spinosa]|uniref:Uncharacterized protein n=1 Tax=Ziziphus jujuba var. spinosa TaxID=714518 RepID=A0A978UP33_ZIZJJ|nr:hypothetical protein FEM48_Zijuj10G0150800 [Ziziphus jujuba var. spinosa]
MKMGSHATIGGSKRRFSSRGVGGVLREQRAKLYIIRRVALASSQQTHQMLGVVQIWGSPQPEAIMLPENQAPGDLLPSGFGSVK